MFRKWASKAAALVLAGVASGCVHVRAETPTAFCMARDAPHGSFYASESSASWAQFRGALDTPFADPSYIGIRYTLDFQGSGEARALRGLTGSDISVSFGRRFRERDLPLHRGGGVRQRRRAEARVTDEAVSIGLERDGWAFFPQRETQAVLQNDGDLELTLYDSHGRQLHREIISASARREAARTVHELAQESLAMARDREANCRLAEVNDEIAVD